MNGRHLLTLGAAGYYAPVPAVVLDATGAVTDFNMAARLLLGARLDACRDASPGALGTLFPAEARAGMFKVPPRAPDSRAQPDEPHRLRVDTPGFGPIEVDRTSTVLLDPDSGAAAGTVVYWSPVPPAPPAFTAALVTESRHQQAWDAYAVSYDRVLPVLPFYAAAVERHVRALAPHGGREILDLGAGTGNVAVELDRLGDRVTAVDLSRAMLARLRCKVEASGSKTLRVVEQNAEHLGRFDDGSFDGVTLLLTLYDMDAPGRALDEAIRVLRPGGTLVVTEPRRSFRIEPLLEAAERHLREQGLQQRLAADWARVNRANRVLDPGKREQRLFAEDIADRLAGAGFTAMAEQDSHLGHCATLSAVRGTGTRRAAVPGRGAA